MAETRQTASPRNVVDANPSLLLELPLIGVLALLVAFAGGIPLWSAMAVRALPTQHSATPKSLRAVMRSRSQIAERSNVNATLLLEITVVDVIDVIDML